MNLTPFQDLLIERCGLFFERERLESLKTAIHSRMEIKGLESHSTYLYHIIQDQSEFYNLVSTLTINETYFFREPSHFWVISERIVPELLGKKKDGIEVRILIAGCATGEEAYSLAISLMERYGRKISPIFSINALDVDIEAISMARDGIFSERKSFRNFDGSLKEKYFKNIGNGYYEILDFVKDAVKFSQFNLVGDSYPESLQKADIVLYRNVSIYFKSEIRKIVFQRLSQILNDGGYLIVGSAETLFHDIGILSLTEMDGVFLYRKNLELKVEDRRKLPLHKGRAVKTREDYRFSPRFTLTSEKKPIKAQAVERREKPHILFDKSLSLAGNKRYGEALSIINRLIEGEPSFIKAYTLKVTILINIKQMEEAGKVCLKILEMDEWHLEGCLLLGLIAKIEGNEDEAMKMFKKALYIETSCWTAHFYLAEIYNFCGEPELACREYRIVTGLLEKGGFSKHGFTLFPLSFPADQFIRLCRQNLEKFKKQNSEVRSQESE